MIAVWVITGAGLARATAAPITVDLAFEVEPEVRGCPDAEAFRTNVRRQLGYDPFASGAERTVVVSIAHRSNGFNGRINWNDASGRWAGERRLSSRKPDCTSLAQDLAFSVAVQMQLLATLATVEPKASQGPSAPVSSTGGSPRRDGLPQAAASPVSPPPVPAAQPAAANPSEARPSSPVPRDEAGVARPPDDEAKAPPASVSSPVSPTQASGSSGVSLWVGLGPALAWALAPQRTPVGRLFVDVRGAWVSVELAVDAAWPVTHRVPRTGGFELERASGTAGVCGHAHVFLGCVLGTAGILRAAGVGLDVPGSPTGAFYQLGARLGARVPLASRYFAGLRMDGLWSPAPWTIEANGVPMWTTPRLGALVGVDVGAIFF